MKSLINRSLIRLRETSPPSAREAAMSAMQHDTFFKHLESFLETSLKHSGNTLKNHGKTLENHENTLETCKKLSLP